MLKFDINLVFTIINIVILYLLLKKFLFGRVHNILEARKAEIDKSYTAAEQAEKDADAMKAQYEASMKNIDKEKEQAILDARNKAAAEYDRIIKDARSQSDHIVQDAAEEAKAAADQEKHKAQEVIAGMVKIAAAKIAENENNQKLFDDFLAEVSEIEPGDKKAEG